MHDDAPAAAESVLQSCDLLSHLLSSLDLRQAMLVARTCLAWRDAAYAKRLEWRILSPEFRVGRHGGEEIACTSDSDDDSDVIIIDTTPAILAQKFSADCDRTRDEKQEHSKPTKRRRTEVTVWCV